MRPGEFVFTDSDETTAPFPTDIGPYAITGLMGEIVYADTNESVPLSEVYDHHWTVTHDGFDNAFCEHGPVYTFGVGAESRITTVRFPKGYGYRRDNPNEYWGANIHLLRTEYLKGEPLRAAKECNECYYAPGKGCHPADNGTFTCCGDYGGKNGLIPLSHFRDDMNFPNMPKLPQPLDKIQEKLADRSFYYKCPIQDDAPKAAIHYKLRYTVNYTDYFAVKPSKIGVWTTPSCETFYDVQENNDEPESLSSTEFVVPYDMEILTMIGHQHTGALNISLFVNDEFVCDSHPAYGNRDGIPGDEQGYLISMSTCFLKDDDPAMPSLVLKKGDTVRLDSWYWVGTVDSRIHPHPGGSHLNVMGYMYTIFAPL